MARACARDSTKSRCPPKKSSKSSPLLSCRPRRPRNRRRPSRCLLRHPAVCNRNGHLGPQRRRYKPCLHKARTSKITSHQSSQGKSENKICVFGYCRVSTDMQVQHGCPGCAARDQTLRRRRGWIIEEIFVDGGFSAKNTDRPAFSAHDQGDQGCGTVRSRAVFDQADRLTRRFATRATSTRTLLDPCGCNLVAIRDGINTFEPVSKMLLPFLAIIGQIERQNTGERVKATIATSHEQGGHYGRCRLGSRR